MLFVERGWGGINGLRSMRKLGQTALERGF